MAEELSRGNLKFWIYQGITLESDNGVTTADLLEFAVYAHKHYPDSKVLVHEYGLRAMKIEGTAGPRLDWRDWD